MHQTFELLILGTSSASPTSSRNPSAQLLNIAERFFLIDCGEGTQVQLRKAKSKFQAIDHIMISHLHGDHFFGLPGLLSSMHLLGRKQEINIYAPEELKEVMDKLNQVSQTKFNFQVNWHFTNKNGFNKLFEDEKLEVFSFPLKHRIQCNGFLFREKNLPRKIDKFKLTQLEISFADILLLKNGEDVQNSKGEWIRNAYATLDPPPARSYSYCSDTIYDEAIVEYVRGVDLLYHESTFLEEKADRAEKTFHSTAKQAAAIAQKAGAKQLLLGHFSARYYSLDQFLTEARPVFENCLLATDGKIIKI